MCESIDDLLHSAAVLSRICQYYFIRRDHICCHSSILCLPSCWLESFWSKLVFQIGRRTTSAMAVVESNCKEAITNEPIFTCGRAGLYVGLVSSSSVNELTFWSALKTLGSHLVVWHMWQVWMHVTSVTTSWTFGHHAQQAWVEIVFKCCPQGI